MVPKGATNSFVWAMNFIGALKVEKYHQTGALEYLAEAERWYERSIENGSEDTGYLNLSYVYMLKGNYGSAEALLRKVLKRQQEQFGPLNPFTGLTHYDLAGSLIEQDRLREAEAHYKASLRSTHRI